MRYNGLPDAIVSNCGSVFILKFWFSLCYFLAIKQKLSIAFYLQTNGQIKRHNSTMETYLRVFVNYKQDNWVWLLSIAESAYNNMKNTRTGHTSCEFNYGYHPCAFYKKDINPYS